MIGISTLALKTAVLSNVSGVSPAFTPAVLSSVHVQGCLVYKGLSPISIVAVHRCHYSPSHVCVYG